MQSQSGGSFHPGEGLTQAASEPLAAGWGLWLHPPILLELGSRWVTPPVQEAPGMPAVAQLPAGPSEAVLHQATAALPYGE